MKKGEHYVELVNVVQIFVDICISVPQSYKSKLIEMILIGGVLYRVPMVYLLCAQVGNLREMDSKLYCYTVLEEYLKQHYDISRNFHLRSYRINSGG